MSSLTIANTDDTILQALDTTLTAATVSGAALFAQVAHAGSIEEAKQVKFTKSPTVVLIYQGTEDHKSTDLIWGQVCKVDLILAAKDTTAALRRTAITRLLAGAKDAIATDPPSDARAFGEGETLHRRLEWESPSLDLITNQPWAVAVLPLRVAYVVSTATAR